MDKGKRVWRKMTVFRRTKTNSLQILSPARSFIAWELINNHHDLQKQSINKMIYKNVAPRLSLLKQSFLPSFPHNSQQHLSLVFHGLKWADLWSGLYTGEYAIWGSVKKTFMSVTFLQMGSLGANHAACLPLVLLLCCLKGGLYDRITSLTTQKSLVPCSI